MNKFKELKVSMYMYLTERSFGFPISYQADINKPNMGLFT